MTCRALLLRFGRTHLWSYLVGFAFLMATNVLVLTIPQVLGTITDALAQGQTTDGTLTGALVGLVVLAFVIFGTRLVWRYLLIGNARKLEVYLRGHLFAHLQTLPVGFYTERKTGDLVSYAINDVQALRMAAGAGLLQGVDAVMVAGIAVFFLSGLVSSGLLALTLFPLVVALGLVLVLSRQVRVRFQAVQESFSAVSDQVQETLSGIRVIKSFAQEAPTVKAFEETGRRRVDAQNRLARASALLGPVIQVCFGVSFFAFLLFGTDLVRSGGLTVGGFVATSFYLLAMVGPVSSVSRIIEIVQKGRASFQRLEALFAVDPVPRGTVAGAPVALRGDLRVTNLSFRYPGDLQDTLKDISFSVGPGRVLGIVGPTGAGKTTLMNLLLRLHPVAEGLVSVDGRDLNDLPLSTLREAIGYVPQDHFLFSTSIRQNIDFFRPDPADDEVEEAARQAGLSDSIAAFPEGFETQVGDRGVTLSGGQKQRVSLARALVKDPRVLILDDSLSAVDVRTEAQILANLRAYLADRAGIVVSHRVVTVKDADEILVLEGGRITARGTHAELAQGEGLYARLCRLQGVAP